MVFTKHYDVRELPRFDEAFTIVYDEDAPKTADTFEWSQEDDELREEQLQKAQEEKLKLSMRDPGILSNLYKRF